METMTPLLRGLSPLLFISLLLCLIGVASAQTPNQVTVNCLDVNDSDLKLTCNISFIPPTQHGRDGTTVSLDLASPTIHFRISLDGYIPRDVQVNAATFRSQTLPLDVYLAPRIAAGQLPTLDTLRTAKKSLENNNIDRAIAIVEQIAASKYKGRDGSTFQVRYLYYRMSALYNGCTKLFLYTCDDARAAIKELRSAVENNSADFFREHIFLKGFSSYATDLDIVDLRNTVARGDWYLDAKKYDQAETEYQRALLILGSAPKGFSKAAQITSKILEDNIQLANTKRKLQQLATTD